MLSLRIKYNFKNSHTKTGTKQTTDHAKEQNLCFHVTTHLTVYEEEYPEGY